ncbi:uncharacterized protein LOC122197116 [Lactuca sativa]|uniref:uncharacterized protein LOC122197116 n=1 Tax=Lactuca sativa TaxID=4236 RepID=UPI000CAF02DB|nr:uncharacterized protein LOC122197116 [Lactuca sativa]
MLARVTILCVILSLLLAVNAAALHPHQLQASNDFGNEHQHHHSALPRKLMVNRKVNGYEAKDLAASKEQNKPSSGELHKILVEVDVIVHVAKGTRQEWIEGSDTTHEFFTMDYSHVRRRWPIHNKSSLKTIINSP